MLTIVNANNRTPLALKVFGRMNYKVLGYVRWGNVGRTKNPPRNGILVEILVVLLLHNFIAHSLCGCRILRLPASFSWPENAVLWRDFHTYWIARVLLPFFPEIPEATHISRRY